MFPGGLVFKNVERLFITKAGRFHPTQHKQRKQSTKRKYARKYVKTQPSSLLGRLQFNAAQQNEFNQSFICSIKTSSYN